MRAGARPGPQGGRDAMVPWPDQAGPGVLSCRVVRHSAGGARAVSTHGKYRADLVSRWPSSRRAHGPLVVGPDRAIRVSIGSVPERLTGRQCPGPTLLLARPLGLSSPRATLTIPGRTGPARTDIRVIPGRLPLELHVTQPILAGWRPATDHPVHETHLYPMMTDARLAERGTSQRTALEASGHTSDELPSFGRGLQPPRRQPPGPLPVDRPRSQSSR